MERNTLMENTPEKIKNKSNQMATMHSVLFSKYNFWNHWLTILIITISSFLLLVTFLSVDYTFKLCQLCFDKLSMESVSTIQIFIIAILALFNFIVSILIIIFNPNDKANSHKMAINHYSKIIYDIRNFEEKENKISDEEKLKLKEKIQTKYLDDNDLPKIPENKFLSLKANHKKKVKISKILDEKPSTNIFILKIKMFFEDNFK